MVTASMQPPVSITIATNIPYSKIASNTQLKVQLDVDAIDLWLCAIRNTPTGGGSASADVFDLLPIAVHQLGENFDLLGKVLHVIESYMLLDINRVLQVMHLSSHSRLFTHFPLGKDPRGRIAQSLQLGTRGNLGSQRQPSLWNRQPDDPTHLSFKRKRQCTLCRSDARLRVLWEDPHGADRREQEYDIGAGGGQPSLRTNHPCNPRHIRAVGHRCCACGGQDRGMVADGLFGSVVEPGARF
jgi:hypothetical protein